MLDSRGRPTVAVRITTREGTTGGCSVPSGAPTGSGEAAETRDGCGCGQLKAGAPARGERVAEYNRLMAIEAIGGALPYGIPT